MMLTRAELEGMYEDTGGVRVRAWSADGRRFIGETWGDFVSPQMEGFSDPGAVQMTEPAIRVAAGVFPDLQESDVIATRRQSDLAEWVEWRVRRLVDADGRGDEVTIMLGDR